MDVLLSHSLDLDIQYGESDLTALMLSATSGRAEMCQRLIGAGANMAAVNSMGSTCLHLAAANNQVM